jgi:hypothetical protein
MVHDPRSPCEESQEAVHLVVLVEMLQETLVDGVQVDDKKSRSLAAITAHHREPEKYSLAIARHRQVLRFHTRSSTWRRTDADGTGASLENSSGLGKLR